MAGCRSSSEATEGGAVRGKRREVTWRGDSPEMFCCCFYSRSPAPKSSAYSHNHHPRVSSAQLEERKGRPVDVLAPDLPSSDPLSGKQQQEASQSWLCEGKLSPHQLCLSSLRARAGGLAGIKELVFAVAQCRDTAKAIHFI